MREAHEDGDGCCVVKERRREEEGRWSRRRKRIGIFNLSLGVF